MPGGLPLLKPPYGRITAIDMNTGEHIWMQPNGPGPRDHPAIADLDLPWLGQRGRPAPLLTRTLLFLGEGTEDALSILPIAGGKAFRAWDKETGEVVWEMNLPAGTSGAPMTYLSNGRQFVVVAVGDRDTSGRLIALALPLACAGLLGLVWARGIVWALPAALMIGGAQAITYAASVYYSLDYDERRGLRTGIHEAVLAAGGCLPILGGWLADRSGEDLASLWLMVAIGGALSLGVVLLLARAPRAPAPSEESRPPPSA